MLNKNPNYSKYANKAQRKASREGEVKRLEYRLGVATNRIFMLERELIEERRNK